MYGDDHRLETTVLMPEPAAEGTPARPTASRARRARYAS